MTYAEFRDLVKTRLKDDAEIEGFDIDECIAMGTADLVDHLHWLRPTTSVLLSYSDQIYDPDTDEAGLFEPPLTAFEVRELWVIDDATVEDSDPACRRGRYRPMPWSKRHDLLYGRISECSLAYCLNPDLTGFYISPPLEEDEILSLHYETIEPSFPDDAKTRFLNRHAYAVADFVRSRIAIEVEEDDPKYRRFNSEYRRQRLTLYSKRR